MYCTSRAKKQDSILLVQHSLSLILSTAISKLKYKILRSNKQSTKQTNENPPHTIIPSYDTLYIPDFDELFEETVQKLGIAEHPQRVSRGGRVDNDAVKLYPQLVVSPHHFQNLNGHGIRITWLASLLLVHTHYIQHYINDGMRITWSTSILFNTPMVGAWCKVVHAYGSTPNHAPSLFERRTAPLVGHKNSGIAI